MLRSFSYAAQLWPFICLATMLLFNIAGYFMGISLALSATAALFVALIIAVFAAPRIWARQIAEDVARADVTQEQAQAEIALLRETAKQLNSIAEKYKQRGTEGKERGRLHASALQVIQEAEQHLAEQHRAAPEPMTR